MEFSNATLLQHRKGNDNANADALSRQPEPDRQSEAGERGKGVTEGQTSHGPKG